VVSGISVGNFIGGRLASLYGSMAWTTLFGIIAASASAPD
jgi:hypothetical protein